MDNVEDFFQQANALKQSQNVDIAYTISYGLVSKLVETKAIAFDNVADAIDAVVVGARRLTTELAKDHNPKLGGKANANRPPPGLS